ncbi:hypothetical protein DFS34DRAFT_598049 [Phlyctochytrium arcticum]|nr:hypothetical protein DFS34DRAFT_598049 [Phlyctochytrium arcticum]
MWEAVNALDIEGYEMPKSALFKNLTQQETNKINEATWTERYIQPLMELLDTTGLTVLYDSTTEYDALRPDIHVHLKGCPSERAVASFEVKSPWARPKEAEKDLSRVILSCISYHKLDEKSADTDDEVPTNIGVHLKGRQGYVYEVYLYQGMFVAVEVGELEVPSILTRGKVRSIANALGQWSALTVGREMNKWYL